MELSFKAKKEIRQLLDKTSYIYDNGDLFGNIFDILKNDLDFFNDVTFDIYSGDGPASFDTKKRILRIDPVDSYYFAKKNAYSSLPNKSIDEIEKFTKEFLVFIMLHEAVHVEQSSCLLYDYSIYQNINELYKKLNKIAVPWNIPYFIKYAFDGEGYSFERHANILAFKEILDIILDEYKSWVRYNYLYNFMLNYYKDKGNIIYPVKKTMSLSLIKYDISSLNVPLYERLIHGLDLSYMEYMEFIEKYSKLDFNDDTYVLLDKDLSRIKI